MTKTTVATWRRASSPSVTLPCVYLDAFALAPSLGRSPALSRMPRRFRRSSRRGIVQARDVGQPEFCPHRILLVAELGRRLARLRQYIWKMLALVLALRAHVAFPTTTRPPFAPAPARGRAPFDRVVDVQGTILGPPPSRHPARYPRGFRRRRRYVDAPHARLPASHARRRPDQRSCVLRPRARPIVTRRSCARKRNQDDQDDQERRPDGRIFFRLKRLTC